MQSPVRLALWSLVLGVLAQPVLAQDGDRPSIFDLRAPVRALAFDPTHYFRSPSSADPSIIRIVYTGDDVGWPVYAIAVANGCIDGEADARDQCASRLRARMVRAPAPPGMDRPRQRGLHLLDQLAKRGATSTPLIRAALAEVGTEWLEADLRTCPGVLAVLNRATEPAWVANAIANVGRDPTVVDYLEGLTLHSDMVQVEFQQHFRRSTYRGDVADGTPGGWAEDLATAIEPCWRPASARPPWSGER
jgi:hypothetical protein